MFIEESGWYVINSLQQHKFVILTFSEQYNSHSSRHCEKKVAISVSLRNKNVKGEIFNIWIFGL